MNGSFVSVLLLCLLALGCAEQPSARTTTESQLLEEIGRIKAIDNHAHPAAVVGEGDKPDDEFDALPLDALEPFPSPVRLRPGNPEYASAWHAFFRYPYTDVSPPHVAEGMKIKQQVMREHDDSYPTWVLDQLGIDTLFANRVAPGRGLNAPRFRWVPFVDALILPLSNERARRSNNDYRDLYPNETRLLRRYLRALQIDTLPTTLDAYLHHVVTPTLERQRHDGAVAVKFEAAYLRRLDFDDAAESDAQRIYGQYVSGGEPPVGEYKVLQDFLFRYIARESGRLGLAVHIHVLDGAGGYYTPGGSNPALLESAFNDPSLRKTSFVIVHGGYPFTRQVASLLAKPNVYADFSGQTFYLYPRGLSDVLRNWLESFPEKGLFGTDASPISAEFGWEETGWLSTTTARRALALALMGMLDDGEITRVRASELANMVLRENAMTLYGLRAQ